MHITISLVVAALVAPAGMYGDNPHKSDTVGLQTGQFNPAGIAPAPGVAQQYRFLDIVIPGGTLVNTWDINNRRVVAGTFTDANGFYQSFVWEDGSITIIDHPDADQTLVSGITDSGLLFGNWGNDFEQHAGYYDLRKNTWTALPDIPGYTLNFGNRMTDNGTATGYACNGTAPMPTDCVAWIWRDGEYSFPLDDEPFNFSQGFGVNNRGEMVAFAVGDTYFGYVLARRGEVTPATALVERGPIPVATFDINANGTMVGTAPVSPDPMAFWSPVLFRGNTVEVLPMYPGSVHSFYIGLNDRGDVVGLRFPGIVDPSAAIAVVALRGPGK